MIFYINKKMDNSVFPIEILIKIMTQFQIYKLGLCCKVLSKELKNYTYVLINKSIDNPNIQGNIIGKKIYHIKNLSNTNDLLICCVCNVKILQNHFRHIIIYHTCNECNKICCSKCHIIFKSDDNNDHESNYYDLQKICKNCFDNNEKYHCKICNTKQKHFNFQCHQCNNLYCDKCYKDDIYKYQKSKDPVRWDGDQGDGKGGCEFKDEEDKKKYYYKCNQCVGDKINKTLNNKYKKF